MMQSCFWLANPVMLRASHFQRSPAIAMLTLEVLSKYRAICWTHHVVGVNAFQ